MEIFQNIRLRLVWRIFSLNCCLSSPLHCDTFDLAASHHQSMTWQQHSQDCEEKIHMIDEPLQWWSSCWVFCLLMQQAVASLQLPPMSAGEATHSWEQNCNTWYWCWEVLASEWSFGSCQQSHMKSHVFISHVGQSYSQQSGIELKVKRRLAYLEGASVALVKMLALRSHLTWTTTSHPDPPLSPESHR